MLGQGRNLPGYNVAEVESWIGDNVPTLKPPFKWTQLIGGHSNLTYKLTDQHGRKAVVRRPPEGELLPKAHDMSREWALISALEPTDVPVPAPLGFCESPEITGTWFYVMGWVDGVALHGQWPPFSIRAGRPRYPGDYIRRQFAEAVVTNTVQASTTSDKF